MNFDELWRYASNLSPMVQERSELEHVFDIMKDCESYLEIGTAEGNSLYVLAHALKQGSNLTYIDWGEKHTTPPRDKIVSELREKGYQITEILADTNFLNTRRELGDRRFDVVMIDAGHDDFNVVIDAMFYGPLAKKFLFFHDIAIPDVQKVFDWYLKNYPYKKAYTFRQSEHYGYGIIKL